MDFGRRGYIAFLSCVFFLFAPLASGAVYKCVDSSGRTQYQDRRCDRVAGAEFAESQTTASDPARHLLWQVTGPGGGYLLGSIHYGHAAMYPLSPTIMKAFDESDALVVEADVTAVDEQKMIALLADKGIYREGQNLQSAVEADTWEALHRAAKKLDLPMSVLASQKPWFAALTLTGLSMRKSGYSEELGLDRYFLQQAAGRKPIIELESVDQQIQLLAEFSPAEQEAFLRRALRDMDRSGEALKAMFDAWAGGNAARMEQIVAEGFDGDAASRAYYRALFLDRNRDMANRLAQLMKDGRTYFVVVGAGHLVGQGGIVNLLVDRGFILEQR